MIWDTCDNWDIYIETHIFAVISLEKASVVFLKHSGLLGHLGQLGQRSESNLFSWKGIYYVDLYTTTHIAMQVSNMLPYL